MDPRREGFPQTERRMDVRWDRLSLACAISLGDSGTTPESAEKLLSSTEERRAVCLCFVLLGYHLSFQPFLAQLRGDRLRETNVILSHCARVFN